MSRTHRVSVRLSEEEYEWFRRKAHWENKPMARLLRQYIHTLIAEEGYLRPPDDEPQDFGYEKEMMQFVLSVQNERDL
ncbi:MAG: ribbon-helix-helix protein, CopG family [Chloroherpetonaceae bacterium]|nr:ribbon-helix-helix protein, CopG family [Chthonomonadaceae bacterium]MDW8208284.1 ribbon-helix-helix protein, CopG family [Chloroherpetonaceae bacterium]